MVLTHQIREECVNVDACKEPSYCELLRRRFDTKQAHVTCHCVYARGLVIKKHHELAAQYARCALQAIGSPISEGGWSLYRELKRIMDAPIPSVEVA